jgi:cob(I)alamin adenosyltransferase
MTATGCLGVGPTYGRRTARAMGRATIRRLRCAVMKVYTKRGDDGTTGLLYGGRVDKDDVRTTAYGTVDEAVSALGMARAALEGSEWADAVLVVQRQMFIVGAQLATHVDHWTKLTEGVSLTTPAMVDELEVRIDAITDRYPLPQEFVVPGGSVAGAAIDMARTIARRAERAVVGMQREGLLPDDSPLRYLNRLSDYLFVLARAVEGGAYTRTRE